MELNTSSLLTKYLKRLKPLLNTNLEDIFIFGSVVGGGLAKDIDLALLLKEKVNISELKRSIQVVLDLPTDIQILTLNSVYSSLWLTLLKEGYRRF